MNIKQGYLGLAAIVLNLLICWVFWEIALSGSIHRYNHYILTKTY